MTTGVVRELKRIYGSNASIVVATDAIEVYKNNPRILGVIPYEEAGVAPFNVVYNLDDAYEINPENHYVDSYFYRVFGHTNLDRSVELFPSDEDKKNVDADLKDIGDRFVVFHMRNWHWQAKNIDLDVWFDVLAKVFTERTDFKVVCVGGATDHYVDHPLLVDARDRYNIQELKHLMDHALCFVGVDSAPLQCAAASKTHIIPLLTHLKPERIVPHRRMDINWNATPIQTLEDCAGCNDNQQIPIRQIVCRKGTTPCTGNFDTDAIAQAILKVLE
jgi:ADP-heptose:LPS heptosyltransferase